MVYGLHDLCGIHSPSTMLWFLEFWWFMSFLRAFLILGKTVGLHVHLFWLLFSLGWMVYEFHYLKGVHNSPTVHWVLGFWWFMGFLRGLLIFGKMVVFLWFFTFHYFDCSLA